MQMVKRIRNPRIQELLFQFILLTVVFIFYSFDHRRRDFRVDIQELVFFLNYVLAAFFINYYLLPRYLYRKKYLLFVGWIVLVITFVIVMEEGVLEKIYYPDTRGTHFPGVFFNLVGALPTITILTGFKFAWDALTKQKQLEQLQVAVKESELLYLKSQINPHFLFNNLNNLYAYALEKSEKTPGIILELSGVLRYMLYECQEKFVPLKNELEQLGNFINLSQLQFEERGEVIFEVTRPLPAGYRIAPLILSVFVENAFKHSLSSQSKNIKIAIHVKVDESGHLWFTCTNSFSEQSNTNDLSKGIGLENVRKRLDLLYPAAYELDICAKEEWYKVDLRLDLKKGKE